MKQLQSCGLNLSKDVDSADYYYYKQLELAKN